MWIIIPTSAQNNVISYEKIDEISNQISKILYNANGIQIKNNNDTGPLTYTRNGFKIYYPKNLATYGYYYNNILYAYDDIDLTKVDHINVSNDAILMKFPQKSIRVGIYNGENYSEKYDSEIVLYYKNAKDRDQLLQALFNTVHTLRVSKGNNSTYDTSKEWSDFISMDLPSFNKKYPRSILASPDKYKEFGRLAFENKDYEDALFWYNKLAIKNDKTTLKHLGEIFYSKSNYDEAFKYYSKAAELGDAYSMYCLGYMYNKGVGVKMDYKMAVEYLQKAKEMGYATADKELSIAKHALKKDINFKKSEFSGIGYYGGIYSPLGLSITEGDLSINYGINVRGSMWVFKGSEDEKDITYDENFNTIAMSGGKKFSDAFVFTIGTGVVYPLHWYTGIGVGRRGYIHKLDDNKIYRESIAEGFESELGIFINTGKAGALRLGATTTNFKTDFAEVVFGFVFNF